MVVKHRFINLDSIQIMTIGLESEIGFQPLKCVVIDWDIFSLFRSDSPLIMSAGYLEATKIYKQLYDSFENGSLT